MDPMPNDVKSTIVTVAVLLVAIPGCLYIGDPLLLLFFVATWTISGASDYLVDNFTRGEDWTEDEITSP